MSKPPPISSGSSPWHARHLSRINGRILSANNFSPTKPSRPAITNSSTASVRYVRWNAVAMVLRANKDTNVGGHIASFASAATLYDVGFNHFWHAPSEKHGGDLVFVQGHSAPGVYARAFMLGRLTEAAAGQFPPGSRRQGTVVLSAPVADAGLLAVPDGVDGPGADHGDLSGALHEVPAGSRHGRTPRAARSGVSSVTAKWTSRNRWARSAWPAREKLDNLIFVVNCNLQRLDGPVRGNGKIIQELEGRFPWRRLERDQGDLGLVLGSAAGARHRRPAAQAHGRMRRRRVPDLQVEGRRLCARAFLRQVSGTAGAWWRTCPTTTSGA